MKSPRWYSRSGDARWEGDVRHARRDKALPSVTSIIEMWPKSWLEPYIQRQMWQAAITTPRTPQMTDDEFFEECLKWSEEHRTKAADRGTRIHRCIHGTQKPEPDIAPFFDAWSKWNSGQAHDYAEWQEKTLVSLEHGYAGQADRLIVRIHPKPETWILDDFKTSAVKDKKRPPFYDNFAIQLAAYRHCLAKDRPIQCRSIVINTLEPEAPYVRVWSPEEIEQGWQRFKLCYEMFVSFKNYDPRKP